MYYVILLIKEIKNIMTRLHVKKWTMAVTHTYTNKD